MLRIVPIRLRAAQQFVLQHHRHNMPPHGWQFGTALRDGEGDLVGVAVAGRPSARELDDELSIEVTRTCTTGARNANSMLYGTIWRAARALGYLRGITYTRADESGASLRAVGWEIVAELPARADWIKSSVRDRALRDPAQFSLIADERALTGGVARLRWEKRAC